MTIVVLGIVYRNCPIEIREKFSFSKSEIQSALSRLRSDFFQEESVILSTCNRTEIYGVPKDIAKAEELLQRFLSEGRGIAPEEVRNYSFFYRDAAVVRHLFRVVAGLDSMVLGENEIVGQVKEAFQMAQEARCVRSLLYQLFERSLRISKQIRTETKINEGAVSVSSVAAELAEKIFGKLRGERVFILGTGKMSELTVKHLQRAGAGSISIASRRFERAEALAKKYSAEPVPFSERLHYLKQADIVLSSTGARHAVLRFEDIHRVMAARRYKSLFIIDIAVPRDVDPEVNKIDGVYLYNIDDLRSIAESNLSLRKKEIQKCEALIEEKVAEFVQWWQHLEMIPTIRKLQRHFDETFAWELDQLRREFADDPRLGEIERLLKRVKGKLLHSPLTVLKELSSDGGGYHYLEALQRLFRLEGVKLDEDTDRNARE